VITKRLAHPLKDECAVIIHAFGLSPQGSGRIAARRYLKLGFGGAHTDSNQRLMYTSA
jgi:hypothetical protein